MSVNRRRRRALAWAGGAILLVVLAVIGWRLSGKEAAPAVSGFTGDLGAASSSADAGSMASEATGRAPGPVVQLPGQPGQPGGPGAPSDAGAAPATEAQVSATELFSQFKGGSVGADARYRGKRLQVAGAVASIEQGAEGVLMLALTAGNGLEQVRALVAPADQERAAALQSGAQAGLNCLYYGAVMGEPVLADCRLAP